MQLGRQLWIVDVDGAGVTFRAYRHKYTLPLTWAEILRLAERVAGEREYLARRGGGRFHPEQVVPARNPLLGYALRSMNIEGQTIADVFLRVDTQPEVGQAAYDAGGAILRDFFHRQVRKFTEPDLDPLGRQIIDCCLSNGSLADYEKLIPHEVTVQDG